MPIPSRIKAVARALDPKCWSSYSGRTILAKRFMEARRACALEAAIKYCEDLTRRVGLRSANSILDQHDKLIERWSGADWTPPLEKTMPTNCNPWPGFKAKIFIHIATCPHYTFLQTLAPASSEARLRTRLRSFDGYVAELVADGLVEERHAIDRVYTLTLKGKVFADAMLSLPLPVATEPKWIMPS